MHHSADKHLFANWNLEYTHLGPLWGAVKGNEENQPSIAGWRSNVDTVITYS